MLGGEPIDAARAVKLGIVDRLVTGADRAGAAVNFLRELIALKSGPRPLRKVKLHPGPDDAAVFARERERLARRSFGQLAGRYIVECVEAAYQQPFDAALALSRRRFEECRVSLESRALRHVFFAERPTAKASTEEWPCRCSPWP